MTEHQLDTELSAAATTELRRLVGTSDARAEVAREGRRLVGDLLLPATVERAEAHRLAVRVAGEIRRLDVETPIIDVRRAA